MLLMTRTVRRVALAALVVSALVVVAPVAAAQGAQPPAAPASEPPITQAPLPPAAQDGFVPVRPGELEQEQLPAAPLVFVAYSVVWLALVVYVFAALAPAHERRARAPRRLRETPGEASMNFAEMPSSHFLFIPAVLMIGVVIGWILGSRAAKDAYAAELKRREAKAARNSQ